MLVNVGSGGGAAAAPAAGGAAAGGAAAAEEAPKEEEKAAEKEESDDGKIHIYEQRKCKILINTRHGLRSVRLSACATLAGAAVHSSSFLVTNEKAFLRLLVGCASRGVGLISLDLYYNMVKEDGIGADKNKEICPSMCIL